MARPKDWRGGEYNRYEPLWKHPIIDVDTGERVTVPIPGKRYTWDFDAVVPENCNWPHCDEQAVRHTCNAEGDRNRTHHHGGIHRLHGRGTFFCEPHGLVVLAENEHPPKKS